jgi:biotin carboxylase
MLTKILVIGGGLFQDFAIKKAKDLGFFAICVDMDKNAPGRYSCDVFINESTRDYKAIINALKKLKIKPDGVITVGTDMSRTVFYVSKEFGLDPGFKDPDNIVNKVAMREVLLKHGVSQPGFVYSENVYDLIQKKENSLLKYPLVIKPSENMGARGVVKVYDDADVLENFKKTQSFALDTKVILEEFMDGPELSVECIVNDKKCHVLVIGDRYIEKEPYFVETGHSCPSRQDKNIIDKIQSFMQKAADSLGIYNGPCKGDIKICNGRLMIGEIAGRLSGGFMSSHTLPISTGIDAIGIAIRQRASMQVNNEEFYAVKNSVCIERAIIPQKKGVIKSIDGVEKALNIEGVRYIHFNLKPGDKFGDLVSNIGKVGNIIIESSDFDSAQKIYKNVIETIKVDFIEE